MCAYSAYMCIVCICVCVYRPGTAAALGRGQGHQEVRGVGTGHTGGHPGPAQHPHYPQVQLKQVKSHPAFRVTCKFVAKHVQGLAQP